jgi:hypothetical protein
MRCIGFVLSHFAFGFRSWYNANIADWFHCPILSMGAPRSAFLPARRVNDRRRFLQAAVRNFNR